MGGNRIRKSGSHPRRLDSGQDGFLRYWARHRVSFYRGNLSTLSSFPIHRRKFVCRVTQLTSSDVIVFQVVTSLCLHAYGCSCSWKQFIITEVIFGTSTSVSSNECEKFKQTLLVLVLVLAYFSFFWFDFLWNLSSSIGSRVSVQALVMRWARQCESGAIRHQTARRSWMVDSLQSQKSFLSIIQTTNLPVSLLSNV